MVNARGRRVAVWVAVLLVTCWGSGWADAQQPPDTYSVSLDTTAVVGSVVVSGRDVAGFDPSLAVWSLQHQLQNELPPGVEIDALTVANGFVGFSTDTTVRVGSVTVRDGDVALYDPVAETFSSLFVGTDEGVPVGVGVDAVHLQPGWDETVEMLLSFDTAIVVSGVTVRPCDIVEYDGETGSFSMAAEGATVFGSAAVRTAVDAVVRLPDGSLLVSSDSAADSESGGASRAMLLRWDGVTLDIYRDLTADGFPASGVGIDGLDVQYRPQLDSYQVSPEVVSSQGLVTISAVYLDLDDEPAAEVSVAINANPATSMTRVLYCGAPYCDDDFTNGELYSLVSAFPPGLSSELHFAVDDGQDHEAAGPYAGPHHVSVPGDATGDGVHDAVDVAVIVGEVADDNDSTSVADIRTGHLITSWGGADADHDNTVAAADAAAAVAAVF